MTRRFLIETLGCKANGADSDALARQLVSRGWQPAEPGHPPELIVVDSCTVTHEADRQSRRAASRLARRFGPDGATVVVTGCGAEVAPDAMAAVPGVDLVVGNQDKPTLVADVLAWVEERGGSTQRPSGHGRVLGGAAPYARTEDGRLRPRHPPDRTWPAPEVAFVAPTEGGRRRTRAWLKVQEGCDAFCTFCVIPFARGPARSLRVSQLVAQARELEAEGVRELVLTGTALGDYGVDLSADGQPGPTLEQLVERLAGATSDRVAYRLGSLDPRELTPGVRHLLTAHPRVRPHAHVSLQSPHPEILKRMNRRYTADDAVEALTALEAARATLLADHGLAGGVFVGMDVIAGFPGETAARFDETIDRLDALPWSRLHVFPYSERDGTAATRLPMAVPPDARKARVAVLRQRSRARALAHAQRLVDDAEAHDLTVPVLLEAPRPDGTAAGYSPGFQRVEVRGLDITRARALRGEVVTVRPERAAAASGTHEAVVVGHLAH